MKTWDYLFRDYETGEEFLVETDGGLTKAEEIAYTVTENAEYRYRMSPAMGEWLGIDTY